MPIEPEPQPPTPPRLRRLPLLQTVALSYREYAASFADVLRISWVWLAALTALVSFATWLQFSWLIAAVNDLKKAVPEGPTPAPIPAMPPMSNAAFLALFAANFLMIVAGLSIMVAWHRRILLNEPAKSSTANVLTVYPWSYAAAGILMLLAVSVPVVLTAAALLWLYVPQGGGFGGSFQPVMTAVAILDCVALAALMRFSIVLPARAVGDTVTGFKEAWHATAGNTVRLAWGLVLTAAVPVLLVQTAADTLLTPSTGDLLSLGKHEITGLAERMAVYNAASIVLTVLMLPIGAGFLSHAYRYFVGSNQQPSS